MLNQRLSQRRFIYSVWFYAYFRVNAKQLCCLEGDAGQINRPSWNILLQKLTCWLTLDESPPNLPFYCPHQWITTSNPSPNSKQGLHLVD